VTTASRNGKIVTFYSYKGGTGRSMALANVGWILASAGHRVLLIDWDFEAPGLHRYLHPFLGDKELTSTAGLVDFFVDFATAARVANTASSSDAWYEPYASLVRYTVPVQWDEFPEDGALELVPAGRQDAGYPMRAMTFDWEGFYTKGGGIFLEALKKRLRQDYDYVLIDSRTGISDTSGICTVQMPDELVVLFTLNRQSMKGAAAIADSADQLRRKSNGEPGLRIWPVPTRVEPAEKERLDVARDECRVLFERHIGHLPRFDRSDYWSLIEVVYQPYYAYEEVLASFAERTPLGTMLVRMRELASRIVGKTIEPARVAEPLRAETLTRFERPRSERRGGQPQVFVSYRRKDAPVVRPIIDRLREYDLAVWSVMDFPALLPWDEQVRSAADRADMILVFAGPLGLGEHQREEIDLIASRNKPMVPVLIKGATEPLPQMPALAPVVIRGDSRKPFPADIRKLVDTITFFAARDLPTSTSDPNDPQKGLWGGHPQSDGRELTAAVRAVTEDYFEITLDVHATTGAPLTGDVEFHLHPTFAKPVQVVTPVDGRATLKLLGWGAFTAGAVADNGRTKLELDLAQDPSFPANFRAR
jgi:cellulose biosynthesis protein BcsQ